MKNQRVPVRCSAWALLLVMTHSTTVGASNDSAKHLRQRQDHEQQQRQQRKYPDARDLAQAMEKGEVNERLHIQFELPTTGGAEMIQRRAQKVAKQLKGLCSQCYRAFPVSKKHEKEHEKAGLNLHYVCDCPSSSPSSIATSTHNQTIFATKVHNHGNGKPARGENTLSAIGELTKLMIKEQKQGRKNPQTTNVNSIIDEDNEDGEDYWGIAVLNAEHAVQTTEFKGEITYDHPTSSVRGQRGQEAEQHTQHERRKLQDPTDPSDSHYKNGRQSHYAAIDMSSAWEYMDMLNGWKNAKNTIVHVQDSGWDLSHPDLGENKWVNSDEICGNGIDDDKNGYIDDCYGYNHADNQGNNNLVGWDDHGSHVAGTIAANTDNNGLGVAGIAGGGKNKGVSGQRGVSVMTSVVFGKTTSWGHAQAFVYAADNGAAISSNSWSYTKQGVYDPLVQIAIDYAVSRGVLVVVAAGNNNSNRAFYPAAFSNVLAVSATDNYGGQSSFTNHGNWVDIAAPGVSVFSTGMENNYVYKSGTSMACPHVSAVLALGKSLKPSATASELRSCLLSTATNIGNSDLGAGMVNPRGFLECLVPPGVGGFSGPSPTKPPVKAPTNAPVPVNVPTPPTNARSPTRRRRRWKRTSAVP